MSFISKIERDPDSLHSLIQPQNLAEQQLLTFLISIFPPSFTEDEMAFPIKTVFQYMFQKKFYTLEAFIKLGHADNIPNLSDTFDLNDPLKDSFVEILKEEAKSFHFPQGLQNERERRDSMHQYKQNNCPFELAALLFQNYELLQREDLSDIIRPQTSSERVLVNFLEKIACFLQDQDENQPFEDFNLPSFFNKDILRGSILSLKARLAEQADHLEWFDLKENFTRHQLLKSEFLRNQLEISMRESKSSPHENHQDPSHAMIQYAKDYDLYHLALFIKNKGHERVGDFFAYFNPTDTSHCAIIETLMTIFPEEEFPCMASSSLQQFLGRKATRDIVFERSRKTLKLLTQKVSELSCQPNPRKSLRKKRVGNQSFFKEGQNRQEIPRRKKRSSHDQHKNSTPKQH